MNPVFARGLALTTALLTGCAATAGTGTGTSTAPRLLSPNLHIGALDQRTAFELDEGEPTPAARDQAPEDRADTPKKRRRRKGLFFLGVGAAGLGALGTLGFGIGGRVVQAQIANGYDDGSLTRDRADSLTTTGEVMNGLTIGSAVLGLAGVILAATVYGIDHARCGDLPPRRTRCPDSEAPADGPAQ